MHKRTFISLFIIIHLGFIFLQIHKQSYLVELTYQKQKNEKIKQELIDQKNSLTQNWHLMQNRATIKKYAHENLSMKKIAFNQIKNLSS